MRTGAVCVAIGTVAWAIYAWASRPWYALGDEPYYADAARHVAEGQGATTSILYTPAFLAAAPASTPITLEPLTHAAGYSYLLGLFFKLFGASETTGILLVGVLVIAFLSVTYVLARQLVAPFPAAIVTLTAGLAPAFLQEAVTLGNDVLFAVGILIVAAIEFRAPPQSVRWRVAEGCVLALAQVVRSNAVVLVPALAIVIAARGSSRRVSAGAAFVVTSLAATAILLTVTGATRFSQIMSSFYLLQETPDYPGLSLFTATSLPPLSDAITRHLPAILYKELAGLRYYASAIPDLGVPLVAGGMVLATLLLLGSREVRPMILFAIVGTVLTVLLAAAVGFATRLVLFMLPVYLLLIVRSLVEHARYVRTSLAVLLAIAVLTYGSETTRLLRDQGARNAYARDVEGLVSAVRTTTSADGWIATDVPSLLAWHADRATVLLPASPDGLPLLETRRHRVDYVVITSIKSDPGERIFPTSVWRQILDGAALAGYEREQTIRSGSITAVVLRSTRP